MDDEAWNALTIDDKIWLAWELERAGQWIPQQVWDWLREESDGRVE